MADGTRRCRRRLCGEVSGRHRPGRYGRHDRSARRGRILDKLRDTGLDRNTAVFFFADNGGHPENRSENGPLRDYKWSHFEGGLRVPFFAAYPGVFPAGLIYDEPVSTLDIFPTMMALAGLEGPDAARPTIQPLTGGP